MEGKGDLIGVKKIPLEGGLIADILAIYLRCEPTNEPYMMPKFRLEQMCDKVCGDCRNDSTILEIIGSLYGMCMYHSMAPAFDSDMIRKCASILMTVAGECIATLELSRKLSFAHPIEVIEYQRYMFANGDILYDTFRHSLELAREVLREVTRPIRLARDKSKAAQSNQKLPTNAIQPHVMLFMCTFGLSHIAAVLGSTDQLMETVPGLGEFLLMLMSLRYGLKKDSTDSCRMGTKLPQADEGDKAVKQLVTTYYVVRSMELTVRLSCIVSQLVLSDKFLYEVSMAQKRLHVQIENEDVDFAKLMSEKVAKFLKSPNILHDKIDTVLLLEKQTIESPQKKGIGLVAKPKQKIPPARCIDSEEMYQTGGHYSAFESNIDSALATLRNRKLAAQAKQLQDAAARKAAAIIHGNSNPGLDDVAMASSKRIVINSKQKQEEEAAIECIAKIGIDLTDPEFNLIDIHEFDELEKTSYEKIKPVYRYALIVTSKLRHHKEFSSRFKGLFVHSYNPHKARDFHKSLQANRHEANRKKSIQEVRDQLECDYFDHNLYPMPRCLNPATGQYWVMQSIIDHILDLGQKGGSAVFTGESRVRIRKEIASIKTLSKKFETKTVQNDTTPVKRGRRERHHNQINNMRELFGGHEGEIGADHHQARGAVMTLSNSHSTHSAAGLPKISRSASHDPDDARNALNTADTIGTAPARAGTTAARQRDLKDKMNKMVREDVFAAEVAMLTGSADKVKTKKAVAEAKAARTAAAEKLKESNVATSLIDKQLFDKHRKKVDMELTLRDKLTLAGRLGRAEACLDILKEKEKKEAEKEARRIADVKKKEEMNAIRQKLVAASKNKVQLEPLSHTGTRRGSPEGSRPATSAGLQTRTGGLSAERASSPQLGKSHTPKSPQTGKMVTLSLDTALANEKSSPKSGVRRSGSGSPTNINYMSTPGRTGTPKAITARLEARSKLSPDKLLVSSSAITAASHIQTDSKAEVEKEKHFQSILRQRFISAVWSSCPAMLDETDPTAAFAKKSGALNALPPELAANEYARQIAEWKESVRLANEQAKRAMDDQQELEMGKIRTFKMTTVRENRETRVKMMRDSLELKEMYKKELLDEVKQNTIAQREEKAKKDRMQERERQRIAEIREWVRRQAEEEAIAKRQGEEYEKIRLKMMADKAEYTEILRRIEEEARMKYLEERRRVIEAKIIEAEQKKLDELNERRAKVQEMADAVKERVRDGTFKYHHGKFGFYDHTRKEPAAYIRYYDDNGIPYYYDEILGKTTYKIPAGAAVVDATDKERAEYDKIHGEGMYDWNQSQMEMMNSVNNYGGYYGEDGAWVPVDGYYDENGEFVYQGDTFVNDKGVTMKRPKATGTLDFMC